MNNADVWQQLQKRLGEIVCYSLFISELTDLIAYSGFEQLFIKSLAKHLVQLNILGRDVIQLEDFELLSHSSDGIYSMHITQTGKFNIRILFYFNCESAPVFLRAFYERGNKRHTDYTNEIPIAIARKSEMEAGI